MNIQSSAASQDGDLYDLDNLLPKFTEPLIMPFSHTGFQAESHSTSTIVPLDSNQEPETLTPSCILHTSFSLLSVDFDTDADSDSESIHETLPMPAAQFKIGEKVPVKGKQLKVTVVTYPPWQAYRDILDRCRAHFQAKLAQKGGKYHEGETGDDNGDKNTHEGQGAELEDKKEGSAKLGGGAGQYGGRGEETIPQC
ncbi:hypothetical protein GYMLUDRAFT_46444 [Collybiopsis luxurians FD-317 M1]|uniref:Uncharacterized protein n=1 Tax=Collybiopsis luxurians FD-317 M1 TaxID=944289 RepID=A0A0D0C436_9AGAR|nr:hypothetical protein GYMLUDRAFT_46444 [Collybiopsis luxurians FD-317 M1]